MSEAGSPIEINETNKKEQIATVLDDKNRKRYNKLAYLGKLLSFAGSISTVTGLITHTTGAIIGGLVTGFSGIPPSIIAELNAPSESNRAVALDKSQSARRRSLAKVGFVGRILAPVSSLAAIIGRFSHIPNLYHGGLIATTVGIGLEGIGSSGVRALRRKSQVPATQKKF